MGPDTPNDHENDPLLLPFVEALYDASDFELPALDSNVIGDVDEELVPLVELVSSEDNVADTQTLVASALLSETAAHSAANVPQLTPPVAHPAAHSGQPAWLTAMQRSGVKRSLKANPNKARDERKSELIYLRNKVAELEAELGSVLAKRPRLTEARESPGSTSPALTSAWKEIADRQSDERMKAERENVRLKLVLANQLKVAKSLEKILHRKSTAKDMDEFVGRHQMSAPTVDATDADVFQTLLRDVEQLFDRVDAVFDANGLAHTETVATSARVRSDAHSGVSLEIFANKLLPFALHATGDAVWHHFAFAKEHTPFRCYSYSSNKVRTVMNITTAALSDRLTTRCGVFCRLSAVVCRLSFFSHPPLTHSSVHALVGRHGRGELYPQAERERNRRELSVQADPPAPRGARPRRDCLARSGRSVRVLRRASLRRALPRRRLHCDPPTSVRPRRQYVTPVVLHLHAGLCRRPGRGLKPPACWRNHGLCAGVYGCKHLVIAPDD